MFDESIARMAREQYGVFTRAQAKAAGGSNRMIDHRLKTQRWEQLHPCVYAIAGSSTSWHRDEIAAAFWASGVAGGRAAGFLLGLPGCEAPAIEVVTRRDRRVMPRCGITVRVTNRLPREQVTFVGGIPSTSVERTLLDLCGHQRQPAGATALDHALHKGRTTLGDLDHCLQVTARRGRNGCGILRTLIKERAGMTVFPNSPLETVIFELFVEADLPIPELQHPIYDPDGFVGRPDFVYPDLKVIIEGHSKLWHTGHYIEAQDANKHRRFVRLGYRVLYLSWADAIVYREATAVRIREELSRSYDLTAPERAGVWLS